MKHFFCLIAFSLATMLTAQSTISGTITNESGEALESAIVYLEGTQLSAATDVKGYYNITDVPAGDFEMSITYLGYEKQTVDVITNYDQVVDIIMKGSLYNLDEIEIITNKVESDDPFAYQVVDKEELEPRNLGQDVPFLLATTPSSVVTSDAGAGIGYTGIRIRGVDQSRINVTINGVPLNDAESQGVFWVDLPDLASSTSSFQVQRGVGPSTMGAGAYGGSIIANTQELKIKPYANVTGTLGSFNTSKLGFNVGTGLINNKYSIDIRYSKIASDGYIDRATSDLSSYYIALSKVTSNSSLRFITFSGSERTYQSWYGTPEAKVNGDDEALRDHYNNNVGSLYKTAQDSINLFDSDRRFNYYTYDDQVDDYTQTHYQLHYSKSHNVKAKSKFTAYYTRGKGFFEQFRYQDDLMDYMIPYIKIDGDTISYVDLVRRRWLSNHLVGGLFNTNISFGDKSEVQFGGGISTYLGGHYGSVIKLLSDSTFFDPAKRYYNNDGNKLDYNLYARTNLSIAEGLSTFFDLQVRGLTYKIDGIDNDLQSINIDTSFLFFNPKAGLTYKVGDAIAYASLAIANREPDRSDFLDNPRTSIPQPETLFDYEIGFRKSSKKSMFGVNIYYMDYTDQLVLTGDLNDVGSSLRANTPDSYRLGVELEGGYQFSKHFGWAANLTLSRNKIKSFTDVLFDYTNGFERIETEYNDTDISFSPSVVGYNSFIWSPIKNLKATLESKFVGKQYLDNTQRDSRSLDPYFVNNVLVTYTLDPSFINRVDINLMINNVFNTKYSANGYTYSYIFGDTITENFLYPQAGINFLLGATIKF